MIFPDLPLTQHTFLDRHAKSVQVPGTLDDGSDPELDDQGYIQAYRLANFHLLAGGVDVVVTSDATRSRETGRIVAEMNDALLYPVLELHEFNWGTYAGQKVLEVFTPDEERRAHREGWDYLPNDSAETRRQAHDRMADAIVEVRQSFPTERLAIVGHGLVTRCFVGGESGLSFDDARRLPFENGDALLLDQAQPIIAQRVFSPSA